MISDRDRRVLADIEREMRAHDPGLCERLSGTEPGPVARLVHRTTSTTAIVCWILALFAALVLALPLISLLLLVAVVTCAAIRVGRASDADGPRPDGPPPHGMPPYGLPPYGGLPPFGPR